MFLLGPLTEPNLKSFAIMQDPDFLLFSISVEKEKR